MNTTRLDSAADHFYAGDSYTALVEIRALFKETIDPAERLDLLCLEVDWLCKLGRIAEARQRFDAGKRGLQLTNHLLQEAEYYEARLLGLEGKYREALSILDRLWQDYQQYRHDPAFIEICQSIQYLRGMLLAFMEKYEEACPLLEELVVSQIYKEPQFYYYLGLSLIRCGKFEKAQSVILEGFNVGYGEAFEDAARFALGVIYYEIGATAKALREFETCVDRIGTSNIPKKQFFEYLIRTAEALNLKEELTRYRSLAVKYPESRSA
jgi:tetratricopeptide (TPR) repeat protein